MSVEDISKKTVAVLLVLAIVLSITGTWLALNMEPIHIIKGPSQNDGSAQVSLTVGSGTNVPQQDAGAGQVSFTKLG